MSCAAPGDCSAGGWYVNSARQEQAFVVSETNGAWGHPQEVPGTAALNTGGGAETVSVSCAAPGNCSAGGDYEGRFDEQAFVVSETNGIWGTAKKAPGTAALNKRGAEIDSVSCASPGNCVAGGFYTDRSGHYEVPVIGEQHGIWGRAEEAPGTAALNKGAVAAGINSMSCASPGDCSAGGTYTAGMPASYDIEALVAGEKHGAWVTAEEVPGTAALNNGGDAQIFSVSCASPGNCSAGGQYANNSGFQAFVVSETNGIWGRAEEAPGTAALNLGADAAINSVACASAGNCAAGGYYTARSGNEQAILVTQTNHS